MSDQVPRRRLAAILAADVVGYSRLMQADEAGTLALLKCRPSEVFQPLVTKHRGRIVKLMGDGVLVEFASAVDAVECAVQLQDAMRTANAGLAKDIRIVLRIGINLGDVMVEGGDLYGDGVNIAARLEALADWCREVQAQFASRSPLTRDARVKAAVLADPPWGRNYTVTGLQNVTTPVQIWASERGFPPGEVLPGEVAIIAENLPVKPDYRLVPNSWHLDFVPACGPASAQLDHNSGSPDPCADANGFDRHAFHHQFDAAILAFFQKHLAAAVSSAQ